MATIDTLRRRRARIAAQLAEVDAEISALEFVRQPGLPGIPPGPAPIEQPRTRSVHEENYDVFQRTRREKFERLGLAFVPDKPHAPMFINVSMRAIREACADDEELFRLFDAFMAEDWPAKFSPSYPYSAMASQKVWPRILDGLRGHAAGKH